MAMVAGVDVVTPPRVFPKYPETARSCTRAGNSFNPSSPKRRKEIFSEWACLWLTSKIFHCLITSLKGHLKLLFPADHYRVALEKKNFCAKQGLGLRSTNRLPGVRSDFRMSAHPLVECEIWLSSVSSPSRVWYLTSGCQLTLAFDGLPGKLKKAKHEQVEEHEEEIGNLQESYEKEIGNLQRLILSNAEIRKWEV